MYLKVLLKQIINIKIDELDFRYKALEYDCNFVAKYWKFLDTYVDLEVF